MATNPTVMFDPELWTRIIKAANRRRKNPQNLVEDVMRDYLEREADFAWWRLVQREYRGRELNERESAEFVRKIRQARRRTGTSPTPAQAQRSRSVGRK